MSVTPPPPLTDEQLAAIENAIPSGYDGPWTFELDDDGRNWVVLYATTSPSAGLICTVPDYGMYLAEFIATARTAIPQLLAEVRQSRTTPSHSDDALNYLLAPTVGAPRDTELRDAVIAAITEDGLKPRDARQGLVEAMLAAVQPELDRLRAERDQARDELKRVRTREAEVRTVRRQALRDCDQAQDRLAAVEAVCAAAELQATRWEQPLPVPEWVAEVRAAAAGES